MGMTYELTLKQGTVGKNGIKKQGVHILDTLPAADSNNVNLG